MSLEARVREAAQRIESLDFVRVFSDDDADGIAAASVLAAALDRRGIPFHLTMDRLHANEYPDLEKHDHLVLMDQGAGELDQLARHPGDVIVLDHHQVRGRAPRVLHVNPNLEGINGTSNCCASTLAMLVALQLDPTNQDLAPVALAGIVGDRQHVPRLAETNATLAQRLSDGGMLNLRRGMPLDRWSPIHQALAKSVDPYLVGLAGSASKARDFVEELGLPAEATVDDLTAEEERTLTSAVVAHMLAHGVEARAAEQAAGTRFEGELGGRTVDAGELSAMLNACAREAKPGLGVALAAGDAKAFEQAKKLSEGYREDLLRGLLKLERDPPTQMDAIQVFDAVDPDLVGAHCGLGITYVFPKDKPALGLKTSNGNLKVSARATQDLVDAGLDLAAALSAAADEHNGGGGGHPIAAGAMVPITEREAFLASVDSIVEDQLREHAS